MVMMAETVAKERKGVWMFTTSNTLGYQVATLISTTTFTHSVKVKGYNLAQSEEARIYCFSMLLVLLAFFFYFLSLQVHYITFYILVLLPCCAKFLTSSMTDFLSTYIIVCPCGWSNSSKTFLVHIASRTVDDVVTYSASHVDKATPPYFFDDPESLCVPRYKTYLAMLFS